MIQINSGGPFTCIRAVAAVKEQGRREVINTGSTAGTYGGKTNSRFFPEGHQRIDESRAKATGPYNTPEAGCARRCRGRYDGAFAVRDAGGAVSGIVVGQNGLYGETAGAYVYFAWDSATVTVATILHANGGIVM